MGKYLEGTSTAMVLGALTGGIIIGATGGKGLASAAFGTVTGAVSGGIAGRISLIKTDKAPKTCLKTAISIPIAATFTLIATLFIIQAINPEEYSTPRSPSDDSWFGLACILLWGVNSLAATVGSISSQCMAGRVEEPNQGLLEESLNSSKLKLN
jgi:hypothetical protein